jgi:hypothetical protein
MANQHERYWIDHPDGAARDNAIIRRTLAELATDGSLLPLEDLHQTTLQGDN